MVTSEERKGGRGKIRVGVKRYKPLYIYNNREYNQYLIITVNIYTNIESMA